MSEEEAKKVTELFVALNLKAFDGDETAQRAVGAYHMWFSTAVKLQALKSILGGI